MIGLRWTIKNKSIPPRTLSHFKNIREINVATWGEFVNTVNHLFNPRILELGTKRSELNMAKGTIHKADFKGYLEYFGTDIEDGIDVDIVADAHKLSNVVGEKSFDVVISCSTFEHLKYPTIVAHEIMKVLKLKGLLFIQTHQTFPLHAYPYDYFRFSTEALESLFGTKNGFKVFSTWYEFECDVVSHRASGLIMLPSYLNSNLYGQKLLETPKKYIYEI